MFQLAESAARWGGGGLRWRAQLNNRFVSIKDENRYFKSIDEKTNLFIKTADSVIKAGWSPTVP